MLIVCDSGSTKADWLMASGGQVTGGFETQGFNPLFHDAGTVYRTLINDQAVHGIRKEAKRVQFFGAGCSSPERKREIYNGLRRVFSRAQVHVEHDMLGAAIAACGDTRGLVCILGTGSNIAYYNGAGLSETRHGLGYVLGDEGSGTYFGKKLLSRYYYRTMPVELRRSFRSIYGIRREDAIRKVYHGSDVNVFLASFAPFLSRHRQHAWVRRLVRDGLEEFFETNIASYVQYKSIPVHFIGSIAHHFERSLKSLGRRKGFRMGKILVRPVDELMAYYLQKG